jgi:hypothetical protein
VHQLPGEVLYLPAGWWHATYNVAEVDCGGGAAAEPAAMAVGGQRRGRDSRAVPSASRGRRRGWAPAECAARAGMGFVAEAERLACAGDVAALAAAMAGSSRGADAFRAQVLEARSHDGGPVTAPTRNFYVRGWNIRVGMRRCAAGAGGGLSGTPLLHLAAEQGQLAAVRWLLEAGGVSSRQRDQGGRQVGPAMLSYSRAPTHRPKDGAEMSRCLSGGTRAS